ncbi:hypothetical protein J8I29_19670 [Labrys sp. LIt4]|uniref:hypothetical protein n=1 Tax=Labrys sp. LIt4 TaxID=2821355 RepID=UPI001AE03350|nr:hypothetical protein [Labrys sp. LIt4]MBP0581555.1 hypothetical protein [Labrys sp. LIt4]
MQSGNWLAASGLLIAAVFPPWGGFEPGLARNEAATAPATILSASKSGEGAGAPAQGYDVWLGWPDDYRRGFALAIVMEQLSTCLGDGCQVTSHRRQCLAGVTDEAAVELLDRYVVRHPLARSRPVNVTMGQALYELCGPAR